LATATLIIGAIGGPAIAVAAEPAWTMDVTELPSQVTPGADAGYAVTITNNGTSNIAKVFLANTSFPGEDTGLPPFPNPTPNPVYVSSNKCEPVSATQPLDCSLGALRAGKSVTVVVGYSTAGVTGDTFRVVFEANTTGATDADGGTSHGDFLRFSGVTTLSTEGGNFAGRFQHSGTAPVANAALSAGNNQQTLINPPSGVFGVTAEDGTACDPTELAACFGETSEIHIGEGGPFNTFKVVVTIDASLVTQGHSANNVVALHVFPFPVNGEPSELIDNKCRIRNGEPTVVPCILGANAGGGDLQVTVYLDYNGKILFG
jgi:hypothetical protein